MAETIQAAFTRGLGLAAGSQTVTIVTSTTQLPIIDGSWLTIPLVVQWLSRDPFPT
jgi:hypothetical protein